MLQLLNQMKQQELNAKKDFNIELQPSEDLFKLQPNTFDVITLWHVLEHVHELHKYLDTFYSLLAKGGTLIIAVPNYTSYDAKRYSKLIGRLMMCRGIFIIFRHKACRYF